MIYIHKVFDGRKSHLVIGDDKAAVKDEADQINGQIIDKKVIPDDFGTVTILRGDDRMMSL